MTEVIHTDPARNLEVMLDTRPTPDLIELLQTTIWGQQGVIFRSLDMTEMLTDLADPSFLRLVKGGRTVAAAVRNRKRVGMSGKPFNAIHLALFAVHPAYTRQGLGRILAQVSRTHFLSNLEAPGLLYGYIESGNVASLRLNLGLGFRDLGEVQSRIFSRARPRVSSRVETLGADAVPEMLDLLKTVYHDHTLCSFEQSVDPERCIVVRRQGKIVAAAQLHVLHWELLRLPGWQGRIALKVMPHLPILGREFRPADLRFARVGNLYAAKGAEPLIADILETELAKRRLPFAAVLADSRGEVERRILNAIDFGILGRAINGAFHLVGEFKGVDAQEQESLTQAPVIISPKDPL